MSTWTLIRELSQFALGGVAACVAVAAFLRQMIRERPKLTAQASRAIVLGEDLKTAHFVIVKIDVTNGSMAGNSLRGNRLAFPGDDSEMGPATYGTTADGARWFLRSPDEKITAYFPTLSPADIPLKSVNVAPQTTIGFDMPFALPSIGVREAMRGAMRLSIEVAAGRDLSLDVAPVESLHLVRYREDGTHPIELYGPDGTRLSFDQALEWDDFEVEDLR